MAAPMIEPAAESVTAADLLPHQLFDGESESTVEWIAGLMTARRYAAGFELMRPGDPCHHFIVVLEGEIHFRWSGSDSILIAPTGQPTGILPYSRMKDWAAVGWAAQPLRLAFMETAHLRDLVYRAPLVAQRLVSQMTERTREIIRMEESSSRLLALGKLSAGLAHELNNPASAAVRSAARLREVLLERRRCGIEFRSLVLPPEAGRAIGELMDTISDCDTTPGTLDPLARADLELDFADWLESAGAPVELAAGLADTGIPLERFRPIVPLADSRILSLGLRILVADHEILCLTREVTEASRRVSDLVQAVKAYSYMDKGLDSEVDVEQGLDSTLRMFQHQLKQGVQVVRNYAGDLPTLRANGGALNQIWTNLIDNALDAIESIPADNPRILTVRTCREPGCILVEIGDNGPGIPEEVQQRMFEPFYTTKGVGKGTGLGLDIVQRIIRSHRGSIRFDSDPGRTVFQVRLPLPAAS